MVNARTSEVGATAATLHLVLNDVTEQSTINVDMP